MLINKRINHRLQNFDCHSKVVYQKLEGCSNGKHVRFDFLSLAFLKYKKRQKIWQ